MSFEINLSQSNSTDSLGSILLRENPLWNHRVKQYEKRPRKINLNNTISKALISAVERTKKEINKNPINNIFRVKSSALLYKITERTNKLAQPRIHINRENKSPQETDFNKINQILVASNRLIELAKPRVPFKQNLKPSFSVSPNALKAIATPRILELSKPRIKKKLKLQRKRNFNFYATCNSRIEFLAKPRLYHHYHHEKVKRKFPNRKTLSKKAKKRNKKSRVKENFQREYQNSEENYNLHSNYSSRSVILISNFDESLEKVNSRRNRFKRKMKRKLTWMRKFIKNYPLSTY